MSVNEIIEELELISSKTPNKNLEKFGINYVKAYNIRLPELRKIAKKYGKNHELACKLWDAGYHETYLLATMIENPSEVDNNQLGNWVHTFYSWDLVDQACINLLRFIPDAIDNIFLWCNSPDEFVKRTAYSLIAVLAVHDKELNFEKYFPILVEGSKDNRNFVKKSVNWAIRQIGKINLENNKKAIELSYKLLEMEYESSKWIARNALKELESEKVQLKLGVNI